MSTSAKRVARATASIAGIAAFGATAFAGAAAAEPVSPFQNDAPDGGAVTDRTDGVTEDDGNGDPDGMHSFELPTLETTSAGPDGNESNGDLECNDDSDDDADDDDTEGEYSDDFDSDDYNCNDDYAYDYNGDGDYDYDAEDRNNDFDADDETDSDDTDDYDGEFREDNYPSGYMCDSDDDEDCDVSENSDDSSGLGGFSFPMASAPAVSPDDADAARADGSEPAMSMMDPGMSFAR